MLHFFKKEPYVQSLTVTSSGLLNGIWKPQYGAASTEKLGPMPLISIPLSWRNYPKTTKSFAITVVDDDTVPIIGFPWIHWITANIPASIHSLPENASVTFSKEMCQGINSFADGYAIHLKELQGFKVPREKAARYGGFVPVNFAHMYTVKVFALDALLELKEGYLYNELLHAMVGHVVGEGVLYGVYNAEIVKS